MKAREIIFLILIIAAGVFFYHAQTGRIDIDWGEGFFYDFEEFTYEESEEISPPFPALLHVVNKHGEVEIQGTDEDRVTVTLQKNIFRKNQDEAKEVADKLKLITETNDDFLKITTNRKDFKKNSGF